MSYFKILKIILVILYSFFIIGGYKYLLLSLIAIFVHEITHLLFLKLSSIYTFKLKYIILGFSINLDDCNISNNKLLVLYFIGSLSNIILGLVLNLIQILFGIDIFRDFIMVNFVIGFINLLPAFPLDGSSILRNILIRFIDCKIVNYISICFSFLIGSVILIYGLIFNGLMEISINYLILSIFIFINTFNEFIRFNKFNNIIYNLGNSCKCKSTIISVQLGSIRTLFDTIKLYMDYDISVFYIVSTEFEIIDVLFIKDIFRYYRIYGNINFLDLYK